MTSAVNDTDEMGGNPVVNAGAVYVFKRTGTAWAQEQKLVASDRNPADYFGWSVDVDGDYIIVGAVWEDEDEFGSAPATNAGAAYVFKRTGTAWVQQQKLAAPDRVTADNFGYTVSISGSHAIVGAYANDRDAFGNNFKANAGAAYLFSLQGNAWSYDNKIVADDREELDYFGISVAVSGDNAIVGASDQDRDAGGGNALTNAGAVYFFKEISTASVASPRPADGGLSVAPVPTRGGVTISSSDKQLHGSPVVITDLLGREVHRFTLQARQTLDIAALPAGVYTLRLANGGCAGLVKQ